MPLRLTTRTKVLVALALVALGFWLWNFLSLRSPQPPMTGGGPSGSLPGERPELPPAVQKLLAAETKADAKPIPLPKVRRAGRPGSDTTWGRDPFDLVAAHTKGQGEVRTGFAAGLRVLGIVWDTTRRHAIINGSVVRVGDEVEGIRVVAIERDRVTVAKGDQQQILRLGE
jgi:hypothetical protein